MKTLIFTVVVSLIFSMFLLETEALTARDGMVAAWLFEDISKGIVKDVTGNGHDGKIVGDLKIVEGKFEKGLRLDGVDDYVEVPSSDDLNLETFTLAAWVKMSDSGKTQQIITKKIFAPEKKTYQFLSHVDSKGAIRGLFHIGGVNKVAMGVTPVTDEK